MGILSVHLYSTFTRYTQLIQRVQAYVKDVRSYAKCVRNTYHLLRVIFWT
jgi:hypothetical protein